MATQRPSPEEIQRMVAAIPDDLEALRDRVRDSLADVVTASYHGSAADGQVEASCTGMGVLTGITIHPSARRELDNLTLGDAVAEAVRRAEAAGRAAVRDGLAAITVAGRSLGEFAPTFLAD